MAALAPIGVIAYLNQYQKRYVVDTTPEETPLPGDDLLTDEGRNYVTMSIDIDAPPERVWPLINQIGQNKAGFYSFVTFERMVHFLITNTYVPVEEWQDTKVGDWTPMASRVSVTRSSCWSQGSTLLGSLTRGGRRQWTVRMRGRQPGYKSSLGPGPSSWTSSWGDSLD